MIAYSFSVMMKENSLQSAQSAFCQSAFCRKQKQKWPTLFSQWNPRPCDTAALRGERAGRSGFSLSGACPLWYRDRHRVCLVCQALGIKGGTRTDPRPYCPRPPWQLPNHVTLYLNTHGQPGANCSTHYTYVSIFIKV